MKYVFLDTCTIVDCAFTRTEKSNPKLLKRLMKLMEDNHVKLILPEVVQLELEKFFLRLWLMQPNRLGRSKRVYGK